MVLDVFGGGSGANAAGGGRGAAEAGPGSLDRWFTTSVDGTQQVLLPFRPKLLLLAIYSGLNRA